MKCSQCDRPAVGAIAGGQGPALCLEHMVMFQNMISQNLADLRREEESIMDYAEMISGVRLRPPRPAPVYQHNPTTINHLNIGNSNIGVINTGTINKLNSAITFAESAGMTEFSKNLKDFTEAVLKSTELQEQERKEVLEHLSFLVSEIQKPKNERNTSVAKNIYTYLEGALTSGASLATLWQVLGPSISKLLFT